MSELKSQGPAGWYKNWTGYYNVNKKSFDDLLKNVQKARKLTKAYGDELNQRADLLGNQFDQNIKPFRQFLEAKGINDAIAAKTGSSEYKELLAWLKEMTDQRRALQTVCQDIQKFPKE